MNILASSNWYWVFIILGVFALIALIVFLLRKYVPGLVNYEKEDEETIAKDNVDRILVDIEEDKRQQEFQEQFKRKNNDEEEKNKDEKNNEK